VWAAAAVSVALLAGATSTQGVASGNPFGDMFSEHGPLAERQAKPAGKGRGTRVASLGGSGTGGGFNWGGSLSGGGSVKWLATSGCVPSGLRSALDGASAYGTIVVSSTHRGHSHNARIGGAKRSYHLSCQAADFRVHGNVGQATAYLRNHPAVGGFKHYGGGLYHIDTGPRRSW
jgi:hypothetical protein